MRIVQLVKQLNNTELGKGGTHDTYVLIPNDLDISDVFQQVNEPIEFIDAISQERVTARNTVGREKRIVGLGQYYRAKDLSAGDEIVFERREKLGKSEYYVYTKKNVNAFVFQKSKNGFEILTSDRMNLAIEWTKTFQDKFAIEYLESARKRNDSPETTDFYDIKVNGQSLLENYSSKEIGIVQVQGGKIEVKCFYGWKKHTFEMED